MRGCGRRARSPRPEAVAFSPGRLSVALEECVASIGSPVSGLMVALSGGLDSTVLLAALAADRDASRPTPLRAVHVDHGLHADSARWSAHCSRLAAALEVPFEQASVDARPGRGESPEAAARAARYALLAERLMPGEVLLTAHHADDQLESILLQWLRGGGVRAVAGMRAAGRFAAGWHARPLLGFTREELQAWALQSRLQWLSDPSNLDPRFDRNYLRLEVLPVLRRRWPAAARTAGRVAAQASEMLEMEAGIARADLALAADGRALSLERLEILPAARQRWVLRAWLRALGLPVPGVATLASAMRDMSVAASDRVPCTNWPGARLYRYRNRLYAEPEASCAARLREGEWPQGSSFDLGELGTLEFVPAAGDGLDRARLPAVLEVTSRAQGEQFVPAGGTSGRPLRKWLQERGVLPWRRSQLPVVRSGREIVAVGDLACADRYAARPGQPSWAIAWRNRPQMTESEATEVKLEEFDPRGGD
jgi:tRNA(Ile)-lysidine synthase